MPRRFRPVAPGLGLALWFGSGLPLAAQESPVTGQPAWTLQGDLGLGAFVKRSHVAGREDRTSLLPFGYATWGPLFWRVDTFGIEACHFGSGALEFLARIDLENATGAQSDFSSLFKGENAVPVGLGTFQRLPWGGLFAHVYQDVGASRGQLAELRYAARVAASRLAFYPRWPWNGAAPASTRPTMAWRRATGRGCRPTARAPRSVRCWPWPANGP